MRAADRAWMRREGIAPGVARALRFEVPLLARRGRRDDLDALLDADRVILLSDDGQAGAELAARLWQRRAAPGCRDHVRAGLAHLRRAWIAQCAGRHDLARGMFSEAVGFWLRTSIAILGTKAGAAWVAQQHRRFTGHASHKGIPERNLERVLRAHRANPGASNRELAALIDLSESTVRRNRPPK